MLTTEEGITINDIIQPGLDNPDHPVGVVALSKDCYFTFEDILVNIAKTYHNRNLKLAKYEKDNYGVIKSILSNMEEIISKYLKEIELSSSRNIEGYLFSGKISRSDRREIEKRVVQFLKNKEESIFDETGKFISLENSSQISPSEQNQFFRSCGFFRDWPDGRTIYLNNGNTLTLLTNEEDHIKLVQNTKKGGDINSKHLISYFDLLESLEKEFPLAYDESLGYLTSLPTNLGKVYLTIGSGINFRLKLKVPKQSEEAITNHFKNITDLSVKASHEDDSCVLEISNNTTFYNFSAFLIELINIKEYLK
jgi:hypothetical protein